MDDCSEDCHSAQWMSVVVLMMVVTAVSFVLVIDAACEGIDLL